MTYEFIAPCHFGMESVLKREINDLGYEISRVENGKVYFKGDEAAICRANIFLRTAERVLINCAEFKATSFTELFDNVEAVDWSCYIPKDGKFWVAKAASVNSALFSPSDIQRIIKKAMVKSLSKKYGIEQFLETGASYPFRVFLMKDIVTIGLDTTGESLHKRGYRKLVSKAPVAENLAAAMILLTPWHKDRILIDPFCGSGTIPIEAAMIAANIAPGMNRDFISQNFDNLIKRKHWYEASDEANDLVNLNVETDIQGFDIDGDIIKSAKQNAQAAGVDKLIHFQKRPVSELNHPKKYGFIITNPPYGERIGEKELLPTLYTEFAEGYKRLDSFSAYIITGYQDVEKYFGRKADKNRKIYNGMMKTYYYMFMGPKPPKKPRENQG